MERKLSSLAFSGHSITDSDSSIAKSNVDVCSIIEPKLVCMSELEDWNISRVMPTNWSGATPSGKHDLQRIGIVSTITFVVLL